MSQQSLGTDFRVIGKLGEGSFAEVFKVKSNKNNSFFAIKRLKKRYRTIEEANKLPEVLSLRALQGHPNIIKLFDVLFDSSNGYVAMVFELLDDNLYQYLRNSGKPLSEQESLLLMYQLLKAIAYMHSKNLFHRDIKPENCMINKSTMELKLCDFGSTRAESESTPYTEYVSTRWYRAPECILTSGSYQKEVDIWAIGCILYELLTTRPLFPGKNEIDQIMRIHNVVGTPSKDILSQFKSNPNTQISFYFPQRRPQDLQKLLPNVSSRTIDLVAKLLIYDPRNRISASEALSHPAFSQLVQLDQMWEERGSIIPFPLFVQQQLEQANPKLLRPVDQQKRPINNENEYLQNNHFLLPEKDAPGFVANQIHIQNKPKQPQYVVQPPPQPKFKTETNLSNKKNLPFDPNEARLRAAERIKMYRQNATMKNPKDLKKPKYFNPNGSIQYQKPDASIVQPRLPKLGYNKYFH